MRAQRPATLSVIGAAQVATAGTVSPTDQFDEHLTAETAAPGEVVSCSCSVSGSEHPSFVAGRASPSRDAAPARWPSRPTPFSLPEA